MREQVAAWKLGLAVSGFPAVQGASWSLAFENLFRLFVFLVFCFDGDKHVPACGVRVLVMKGMEI